MKGDERRSLLLESLRLNVGVTHCRWRRVADPIKYYLKKVFDVEYGLPLVFAECAHGVD